MGRAISYTSRARLAYVLASGRGITRCKSPVKSAPALAAGNAFILKPSEMTPLVAHMVADILADAGCHRFVSDYPWHTRNWPGICEHPALQKFL